MPSLLRPTWLLPLVSAALISGCVVHCGGHDDDYMCKGPGCYDDDDGYDGVGGSRTSATGGEGGQGGTGGEGGQAFECDTDQFACACAVNDFCPAGLTCLNGLCLSACDFDYQCAQGKVCGNGQCVTACEADPLVCNPGEACVGGGCLVDPANPQCLDAGSCDGLECVDGFCTTLCASNDECGAGQLCSEVSGACIADLAPIPLCDATTPCPGSQACIGGYCRYACESLQECKLIDARFEACEEGTCKTELEIAPECTSTQLCAGGASCVSNKCVN